MELRVTQETASINEMVYDGAAEQSIECDFVLPDYLPDIVRILKCSITPRVISKTLSGTSLSIEGTAVAEVLYVAPEEEPRCAVYRCPFSKVVELGRVMPDADVIVCPSVSYVNCRAVSQRRLDIRGAVVLKIQAINRLSCELTGDAQGAGIQLKKRVFPISRLCSCVQRDLSIHEDIELPEGNPPVFSILKVSTRAQVSDCKLIAGKIILKGELHLHILYLCDKESKALCTVDQMLPFSQILDVDGVDEECTCDISLTVASCELIPQQEFEENTTLTLDCEISVLAKVRREEEILSVCDVFSTLYESSCEQKQIDFEHVVTREEETFTHKSELNLPQAMESLCDSFCEMKILSTQIAQGKATCRIQMDITMLAYDAEHNLLCITAKDEFDYERTLSNTPMTLEYSPHLQLISSQATLEGESATVTVECCLSGEAVTKVRESVVTTISVDEEKPKERDKDIALTIYYADEGEQVWEIAKRYNTSVEQVMSENDLAGDVVEKRGMLLIPIVTE